MIFNKILYITSIALFSSCKETKQEIPHSQKTKTYISTSYPTQKKNIQEELKITSNLQDWEGLYLNSDDKNLKTYQSIIDKVGWFKLKITAHEILFSADTRMRDDYPQTDPGGVYISNRCNYYISNDNTIEIYRKEYDDPNSTPVNMKGKKEDLLITLYKKDKEFFGTSNVIKDSEQYDNSARIKSNTPYQFYKFSLEENKN